MWVVEGRGSKADASIGGWRVHYLDELWGPCPRGRHTCVCVLAEGAVWAASQTRVTEDLSLRIPRSRRQGIWWFTPKSPISSSIITFIPEPRDGAQLHENQGRGNKRRGFLCWGEAGCSVCLHFNLLALLKVERKKESLLHGHTGQGDP